jgi:SAM-dependent methyltransferase
LSSIDQKSHYKNIHDDYETHYYDPTSMEYRQRFIYDVMFKGLDLNGKRVAELASGSGHNSLALRERFPQAQLTGFDISAKACASYRELLNVEAIEVDLTKPLTNMPTFDCILIFGGLHHCVSDLGTTLLNIADMLEPGGVLLFFEPNSQYILEGARKIWYKYDRYFEENSEAALNHSEMLASTNGRFRINSINYMGGIAFYLIYNSLIFRIPVSMKKYIAPPLFALERLMSYLPGKFLYSSFIGQWIKN